MALVDLDLQRGDVAAFMNLTPHNSLANLAAAPGEIDDVFLASTLTRHPNGVFVLPAPTEIEDADSVGHDEIKLALELLRARVPLHGGGHGAHHHGGDGGGPRGEPAHPAPERPVGARHPRRARARPTCSPASASRRSASSCW